MRTPLAHHLVRLLALSAAWTSSTDPGSTCEEGWVPFGSSCYKKVTITNGWLGARYDCVWEGGDLVSIASSDEEDFVKKQMGDNVRFWIGLSNLNCDEAWCRYDKEQQKLTWSDVRVMASYSNWDSRQVGSSNVESCAYVNQGVHPKNQPGKWRHCSCGSSLPYMCERSPYDCPEGWPCSYKDFGYDRVESSSCDPSDILYNDSCYHFWGQKEFWATKSFCEGRNSHMASVHSVEQGKFLAAHMGYVYGWLGLYMKNRVTTYTDGTSTADIPWIPGETTIKKGCAGGLDLAGSVEMGNIVANRFESICKTAKVREAVTALPPSTLRPDRSKKLDVWVDNPFNDFSYLLNHKSSKTWQEARDDCVGRGGDLLSITNSYEQNFVQGHQLTGAALWLGVNANITEGSKWTDGSSFTYKNLKAGSANDATGARCLSLLTADGRWEFADCKKESSYVCKRRGGEKKSCDMADGWLPLGFSCYKKMVTPNGWLGARHDCIWEGGDLVSIASPDEEAFVKEQMGDDDPFWIGLSNMKCDEAWCRYDKEQKKLTWSDVRVMASYSNWDSSQVGSSDEESCAYVNQGAHRDNQPGKWRHGSCGSSLAFMCERPLNDCPEGWPCAYKDFSYNRVETSYCDPSDFLFDDSCYHFEGMKKVQWAAEKFCRERKGHLTSILSEDEGNFLAAHMRDAGGFQPFVGLRKKKNNFEWFDGKPTDNVTQLMGNNSPVSQECFALSASGQVDEWSCTKEQPSICKTAKVREALPDVPSTRGPGWSEKCGWWMDNPSTDFCYLLNYKSRKTWQEARDDCLGLGGDLLSITNSYEQNFIQGLYAIPLTSPSLWLGAHGNLTDGIEWIDGSMSTYKNLKTGIAGEGPGGSCLSLLTADGRWEFADCKKESSYICKRRGKANPKSACEKGWSLHQSSCYKKMATPNGWLGARYDCIWEGGDLVSITSTDEEAFVEKQMGQNPFWIGLSNLNCDEAWCRYDKEQKKLTWSDVRVMASYSNWDSSQVGSSDEESCAYVNQGAHRDNQPGKWRHGSCGSSLAFMCERPLNDCPDGQSCSSKDFGYDRVETSSCDPSDFLFDDSCYHFEWRRKDWQFAEEFCVSQNGHLVSIYSKDEFKFLAAHVQDDRRYWAYIGLKRIKDKTFSWSSTPAVTEEGGESTGLGDCIVLSASGKFHEWPCTKKQPFVCKKAKVREALSDLPSWGPDWNGKCGSWVENRYDNFCYLINSKSRKTWQEAQDDCLRLGGNLLSITNYAEQTFIEGLSAGYRNITSWWLAAKTTITQEGCKWADGSPFRYTHWTTESPSTPSGENCLYFPTKHKLGKWKFDNCQKTSSYICKKSARGQKPEPSHHDGFREILVCDQQKHVELFCQTEGQSVIRIQSAFYGRRSGSVCPTGSGIKETCVVQGALPHYRRKCDNRQYCLADPFEGVQETCPAVSKYLHMVYSCERKVCLDSLVEADKSIADSAFEASSSMTDASPEKARWSSYSCWRPSQDASTSWIQVNLGHVRKVTGIVTQGCPHANHRSCVDFEIKTSVDGKSWTEHPDGKFTGGAEHQFGSPLSAQYVRILPLEDSVDFGLSFDLLGCARDDAMTCDSTFNSLHLTKAMTFHCPPKCADSQHNVTGTLVYNEDSSVCVAAIHAGVIRNDIGGDCIVMTDVAKNGFAGSTQNGITSLKSAESTDQAFTFADGEPRCLEESWEEFAGFCYKAFEDKKHWADAQAVCRKLGANLVSILSEMEQKWVKKASDIDTSDMWTGLNDLSVLGMFEWSDHHEVTFTDWAPEEPKNLEKDCVAMSQKTGRWKQMSCELPNSFMCKMPKAHYAFTSAKAEESHSGDSLLWHRSKLAKSANVVTASPVELKGGLRVNDVITITGQANKLADWFKINLFVPDDETDNMVALLLKLNFVTKKIWLYSKVSTTWNKREEHPTQSSGPGQEVKVVIKCADDHFLITINDLDEVIYKYQETNLQSITQMMVWGHVFIKDIKRSSA
ncbi:secretory phospholipase A2 receptor-like [Syngnathus scovelli]|uniref:secretory phospholipase A2 receptor-like n=1 Tax=Syngnathus scovelli TaxID=161590 RepID=UPI00210FA7DF|nr:macrophage mannose receptor 1-like [Syngnathus scovelli]